MNNRKNLENDITRIINRIDSEQAEDYDGTYVEELRHIKDEKFDILKQIDDEICDLRKLLDAYRKGIIK